VRVSLDPCPMLQKASAASKANNWRAAKLRKLDIVRKYHQ
jgi:hypothetical protein